MKCRLRFGIVGWLICGAFLFAQSSPSSTEQRQPPASNSDTQASKQPQMGIEGGPIEIVSDTLGVNFGPYLQDVLKSVKQNWYNLIPESARGLLKKQGKVLIEFKILKDGKVAGMKLVESAGDAPLDRAAWGGITASGPFPPLPAEFSGQYLGLRFAFYYNFAPGEIQDQEIGSSTPASQGFPGSGITVRITAQPPVKVPLDSSYVVSAYVKGTTNDRLKWSVSGKGCTDSACGTMIDGLYVAPTVLPDPPMVTVTAISEADPKAWTWIRIHLVAAAAHE
jgi:TonB family protein